MVIIQKLFAKLNRNLLLILCSFFALSWFSRLETVAQTLPIYDSFNYIGTELVAASGGNWTSVQTTATPVGLNTSLNILKPGYIGSDNVGGVATFVGGGGTRQDVRRSFSTVNSGSVFVATMLRVTAVSGGGATTAFGFNNAAGTAIGSRVFFSTGATNTFRIATSVSTSTPGANTANLTINKDYILVYQYEFVAGASNDVSRVWLLERPTATAPATPTRTATNTSPTADLTEITGAQVFQENNSQTFRIDGFSIGTSWEEVMGRYYYSQTGNTDLSVLSAWNTAQDGSGVAPANFSDAHNVFMVQHTDDFTALPNLSSVNSKLVFGDENTTTRKFMNLTSGITNPVSELVVFPNNTVRVSGVTYPITDVRLYPVTGLDAAHIQYNYGTAKDITWSHTGSGQLWSIGAGTRINLATASSLALDNGVQTRYLADTLSAIEIDADNKLGVIPGLQNNFLTLSGGRLILNGSFTLSANRGMFIGKLGTATSKGELEVTAGNIVTYNGVINNNNLDNASPDTLYKFGSGELRLGGTNNYSGGLKVIEGNFGLLTERGLGAVPATRSDNVWLNDGTSFGVVNAGVTTNGLRTFLIGSPNSAGKVTFYQTAVHTLNVDGALKSWGAEKDTIIRVAGGTGSVTFRANTGLNISTIGGFRIEGGNTTISGVDATDSLGGGSDIRTYAGTVTISANPVRIKNIYHIAGNTIGSGGLVSIGGVIEGRSGVLTTQFGSSTPSTSDIFKTTTDSLTFSLGGTNNIWRGDLYVQQGPISISQTSNGFGDNFSDLVISSGDNVNFIGSDENVNNLILNDGNLYCTDATQRAIGADAAGILDVRKGTITMRLTSGRPLVKSTSETVFLNHPATGNAVYTGNTTINDGILAINQEYALGSRTGVRNIFINEPGRLMFTESTSLPYVNITNTKRLVVGPQSSTGKGVVIVPTGVTVKWTQVYTNGALDTDTLEVIGGGDFILSGVTDSTVRLMVSEGTMRIDSIVASRRYGQLIRRNTGILSITGLCPTAQNIILNGADSIMGDTNGRIIFQGTGIRDIVTSAPALKLACGLELQAVNYVMSKPLTIWSTLALGAGTNLNINNSFNTLSLGGVRTGTGTITGGASSRLRIVSDNVNGINIGAISGNLSSLEINHSRTGVVAANAALQTDTLLLTNGVLTSASNVTVRNNGSLIRLNGSTMGKPTYGSNINAIIGNGAIANINLEDEMPGASVLSNLTINVTGVVNLAEPTTVSNSLTLTLGRLNVNGQVLTIPASASITGSDANKYIIANNKTAGGKLRRTGVHTALSFFPVGSWASYSPAAISNNNISDFDVSIRDTVSYSDGNFAEGFVPNTVNKTWYVDITSGTANNATLQVGWMAASENGTFNNTLPLSMYRYPGSGFVWNEFTATALGTPLSGADFSAEQINKNLFSPHAIGNTGGPLPVELISFTAKVLSGNTAQLSWLTAQEVNNAGFEVEYSANGTDFTKVGFVDGAGTTNTKQAYNFKHSVDGEVAYYRLKQVDFDGKFEYSPVVSVNFSNTAAMNMFVSPNPSNGKAYLAFNGNVSGQELQLYVLSANGKLLSTTVGKEEAISASFEKLSEGLANGTYILRLITPNGTQVIKFVKTK